MALTTTAKFKTYAGISASTDDALIADLILRAQSEIERYCQRAFDSTTYREFYDGEGQSELLLKHYPVTAVKMLGVGREDAFQIKNTSSDAYHAYVSVTDTTIQLVVQGGTNEDDTSLTLATYATLTLLIAAIEALGKGWSVLSPAAAVAIWSAEELLPTGKGLRCLDDYAAVQIPDDPETDFTTDTTAGILKLFGRFCRGFQNVVVRYVAGYTSIPADLEQICIDLVKVYYDNKSINSTLQSERLGDYQYTNRAGSTDSSDVMPANIALRLEKWRSRRI